MSGLSLLENATLISQGAEARIFKTALYEGGPTILLKHRFSKQYRHQQLDKVLTKQRLSGEARALARCLKFGVTVPGVRYVDLEHGILGLEWIDGTTLRRILGDDSESISENTPLKESDGELSDLYGLTPETLMQKVGAALAKMHLADIIHGDLTTSNMMLRKGLNDISAELVLIDFGLSYNAGLAEDKAVDLYVLERAFTSTHPDSQSLFATVLQSYSSSAGKAANTVLKRLDEVRLRGRKRSMVG